MSYKYYPFILLGIVFISCTSTIQSPEIEINSPEVIPTPTDISATSTTQSPEIGANSQETTKAISIPTNISVPIKFEGKVSRDQTFEKEISDELLFGLHPISKGWQIWVGDHSKTDNNFSGVATPPFHGMNARYIEGWHFRNSDNSGPNEAGEKNVNAPQHERRFCFVLKEEDYQTSYYQLNWQLLPEEKQEENKKKFELVQRKSGLLTITTLELGNLEVGEQAWIEYMEFEVELDFLDNCWY